jgi:putative methyltransferase (TIGR04325 family)
MHLIEYKLRRHPFFGRFFPTKLYKSYQDALKDCSSKGYENDAIIELIVQKRRRIAEPQYTDLLKQMPLGMILLANTILKAANELGVQTIRVIDFGGADGGHYLQIRRFLKSNIALQWVVVETPAMVAAMKEFETPELKFMDNFEQALETLGGIDVFHTSGTLQSVPEPYTFLEKFCNTKTPFMVFNRQSLALGEKELVSVQLSLLSWHGYSSIKVNSPDFVVKYPHTSIRKSRFEEIVSKYYDIVTQFDENSGAYKIGNHKVLGISYVLTGRENSHIQKNNIKNGNSDIHIVAA